MMNVNKAKDEEAKYKKKSVAQIAKIRHLLRKSEYLSNYDEKAPHTDVDKKTALEPELVCLTDKGAKNFNKYMKQIEDPKCDKISLEMSYVTEKEREEHENLKKKNMTELKKVIFDLISNLPVNVHQPLEELFKTCPKTRFGYEAFYDEVVELVQGHDMNSVEDDD